MIESLEERALFALTVDAFPAGNPAVDLAQALVLNAPTGITVIGATYSAGSNTQGGTYSGFDLRSNGGSTRLAINDGVILTSGEAEGALGPNQNRYTSGSGTGALGNESNPVNGFLDGDTDLNTVIGPSGSQDANSITITFTADATVQSVLFDFIFGSEEFPDFVGSFNDAFAAFLDGTQISFDTDSSPITVNNNFFLLNNSGFTAGTVDGVDNIPGGEDEDVAGTTAVVFDIEYDGLTPVIRTQAPLDTTLVTHTLKFVIGDAGDDALDSGIFISGLQGSTQTLAGPVTSLPVPGVFSFSQPTYSVLETGGFLTATVLREGGSSGLATVDIFTSNGTATATSDYTAIPLTTLTFDDSETSQTFTVPILDDTIPEGDETIILSLSDATNLTAIGRAEAVGLIVDNEIGVRFSDPFYTVEEGIDDVSATITVVLTSPAPTPLSVDYATVPGGSAQFNVDFTPVSGTLVFQPGETTKTFTIPIIEDFLVTEDTETITLSLSNVNAPYLIGLINPAILQIINLDRPPAVLDMQFQTNERFITGMAIRYSEQMDESLVEDLRNYDFFLRKESKKLGGSPTRTRVVVESAVYEPVTRTVTLTTEKNLKENKVYEVVINTTRFEGVESIEGEKLDGNYDNIEGDDFTGYVSRATRISYFERNGDRVGLQLKGPGRLELFRHVERDGRVLRLIDTSQDTILTGTYNPVELTDGLATIRALLTGTGFRNKLEQPPFSITRVYPGFQIPNT